MNGRTRALSVLATLIVWSLASGDTPLEGANGEQASASTSEAVEQPADAESCLKHCNRTHARCGTEVRRARQECSRNAASGGRDPFTGQADQYRYFCDYFAQPGRACDAGAYGSACQARFTQRYASCVDTMYNNVAALRYDCYRAERSAQDFCRAELSDCRAACR